MRHPHRSYAVMVRSELFREQVCRFRRCQYRRPSIAEMRALWRQPGFVVMA